MSKVMILGGTAEAGELAARLAGDARLETVTSLAGLTRLPAPVAGGVRRGGFGGPDGLAAVLAKERYDALIDATHPFAGRIAAYAREAAERAGVPRFKLLRPPFARRAGDRITDVPDMVTAAALLPEGARVFLAAGRREIAPFAERADVWCLVRMIEPPGPSERLPRGEVILGRPPTDADAEIDLFTRHRIGWVVSKDSGGPASAKIEAARRLDLPIVMIARPPHPPGPIVTSVDEAVACVEAMLFA